MTLFHGSAALQGVAYSTLGICSDTPGYHPYFCTGTVLIGETISGQSHICPEMVSPIRVSLHQSNTAEVPIDRGYFCTLWCTGINDPGYYGATTYTGITWHDKVTWYVEVDLGLELMHLL